MSRAAAGRLPPRVVAIDAGHGGKDSGAIGPRGHYEKDIVLAIARRLAVYLRAEPGMRPTLVRRDDRFVPLRARMAIARAARADLFVSLHADADPSGRVQGLSVYTGSRRAPPASAHAAANILREARKSLPIHKHQVQRAGFAVLKSSDIPSVLVETGFISHPKGEKDLANPARQDQIARVLLQSIRRYFAAVPPVRAAERLADAGGPIRR